MGGGAMDSEADVSVEAALAARRVDVHRSPGAAGYASVEHHATETIALMAFPDVQIPVAAFLPPADRRP